MSGRAQIRSRLPGAALAACGAYQIALGAYFVLFRPSLLPEDLRFLGTSETAIEAAAPAVETWLDWVFIVMGGQMAGVGTLLLLLAGSYPRRTTARSFEVPLLALSAGATAVLMSAVNFAIGSDFRGALLAPVALWAIALFCVLRSPAHEGD